MGEQHPQVPLQVVHRCTEQLLGEAGRTRTQARQYRNPP